MDTAPRLLAAPILAVLALVSCRSSPSPPAPSASTEAPPTAPPTRWVTAAVETFDHGSLPEGAFSRDRFPDDGPRSDNGIYFRRKGISPPPAFRASVPFGQDGWLTFEAYSRSPATRLSDLVTIAPDPAGGPNRALRLASPAHTDAIVVRPTRPLPERYRVSLRVGFASFGDGDPTGKNGYRGGERAEPWLDADATQQNGYYWLAILDALPRPHNNVWIHHHRKVVIDSDNHSPPWMEIWDGSRFEKSGALPIMMFAVDGKGPSREISGHPFFSFAAGAFQRSGEVRAVDRYRPDRWYRVSIERDRGRFTMEIAGDFRHGGERAYRASLDPRGRCVFHYNRTPGELDPRCVDEASPPSLGPGFPGWPRGSAYPDWFFFGDPHENYYTGHACYDDVRLEVPAEGP
jgi:hypothetical protein